MEIEHGIQKLLKENGATRLDDSTVSVIGDGVEAAPDIADERSPETYLGYRQPTGFASPERLAQDARKTYTPPARPSLNHWGLSGSWNVGAESAVLQAAPGKIVFRFHSRDLHLVLAPTKDGKPVRFRVTLDGSAPGGNCGSDSAPDGTGVVREPRLYQLIRQREQRIEDRTFAISNSWIPALRLLTLHSDSGWQRRAPSRLSPKPLWRLMVQRYIEEIGQADHLRFVSNAERRTNHDRRHTQNRETAVHRQSAHHGRPRRR